MISARHLQNLLFVPAQRGLRIASGALRSPSRMRRSLMTTAIEPPAHVPESTLSLVLAEDPGFYQSSWEDDFATTLPEKHGMSFSRYSLSPDTPNFDLALQEMKKDFEKSASSTVLVTRGPWMSWQASFYLESLPLAGLVMVDPMQLDDMNGVNQFELQYEKLGLLDTVQYKLYQEYAEHWDHWTLRLEPGSVPMLVLYTNVRPGYKRCAENSALRHGDVPVVKMPSTSRSHALDCVENITTWINSSIL